MAHGTPLISTIVVGLVLAFIFGAIANRFRLPPLVGYLVAGIVVGPYSPGFVADVEIANELSEIGIILLMFGVGLNFSLKDLISVQAVAIPGSLGRIAAGTLMGMGLAWALGWSLLAGIIFGLALSVASTIVLLKAFQDRHLLDSDRGRIAVGWVIVEDIAMILALVLIPAFAELAGGTVTAQSDPFVSFVERLAGGDIGIAGVVAVTVIKLAAFVGFMFIVGRRLIPMVLHFTAHTGSRELFRLAVLAIALGVAAGSAYLFGVSLALGAFFAGMILSESELSHRAAQETLPLRDAFAVLFFVAVGMLFNPMVLITHPLPVLAVLFIILLGKTVVGYLLIVLFRRPVGTALVVSAGLAQVGEFSFILATLGITLGILPEEGRDLILAGAIVSIIVNPAMFWLADVLRPRLEARFPMHAHAVPAEAVASARVEPDIVAPTPEPAVPVAVEEEDEHATALTDHTILAGYGRVGTVIGEGLLAAGIPFVLIEDAEGRVAAARRAGIEVIEGNAATSRALALANVEGAKTVIIAIPNAFEAGQATEQSRKHNPTIRIVARAHSDEEEAHLTHLGADAVVMGEREIGLGMLELLHDPRADAVADSYKHDENVPVVTSDIPNPQPAAPHATTSPVEAALLGEILDEEPLPSDGETLTDDDAEAMTEAEEAEDVRALDGPEAAELEAEIQAEEEPDLWEDAEPAEPEPVPEGDESVEPKVPPVVLPPDPDEELEAKDPLPEPKL